AGEVFGEESLLESVLADVTGVWGVQFMLAFAAAGQPLQAVEAFNGQGEQRLLADFVEKVGAHLAAYTGAHIYHWGGAEIARLQSIAERQRSRAAGEFAKMVKDDVFIDLAQVLHQSVIIGAKNVALAELAALWGGSEELCERLRQTPKNEWAILWAAQKTAHAKGDAELAAKLGEQLRQLMADKLELMRQAGAWLRGIFAGENPEISAEMLLREKRERSEKSVQEWEQNVATNRILLDAACAALGLQTGESAAGTGEAETGENSAENPKKIAAVQAIYNADECLAMLMSAATFDYYGRETRAVMEAHAQRINSEIHDWKAIEKVFLVDNNKSGASRWEQVQRSQKRDLVLRGLALDGRLLKPGESVYLFYRLPAPAGAQVVGAAGYWITNAVVTAASDTEMQLRETRPGAIVKSYAQLPLAVTPGYPISTAGLAKTVNQWAAGVSSLLSAGGQIADPCWDILLRRPRYLAGPIPQVPESVRRGAGGERITRIVENILKLDNSFMAVQGPPGTGKTFTAANVIATLVNYFGYKIGVVAQSHAVVENLLQKIVSAGVAKEQVLKLIPSGYKTVADREKYQQRVNFSAVTRKEEVGASVQAAAASGSGLVFGGTVWNFCDSKCVPADKMLDLLVVEEAGQYSLVPTIAASRAARNLLLLGDPQQLAQVTVGEHPLHIDSSALGWLMPGQSVLPQHLGEFLEESWRMHPSVCEVVSHLAYDGALKSAAGREKDAPHLAQLSAPGVVYHPVEHSFNSRCSPEEADYVVRLCQRFLAGGLLSQDGVIVVAPYNAQVDLLRQRLDAAGFQRVRVGTVDKFQGQEAEVAIVSLAASSAQDVPRGLEFLLDRNRLNVALSRARWSSHLVCSPNLGESLPATAAELSLSAAFLRLRDSALTPAAAGCEVINT
ncbi:MAG: AAA domain-containing protein, partial [Microbacteriaceae bacterium]|nr:AAA domain-containing protein [Microbacteriaceae bacterium]